nr:carbonic anhydrase [Streptomonospora sp. PA3]
MSGLAPRAARGLALVTCMDSRIEPLQTLGLKPGDAKILRNAGARVTDDTLRTLVLAAYLLEVDRVLVMPHTRCKMASVSGDDEVHDLIEREHGVDTRSLEFGTDNDQLGALRHDLERIRHHPLLPDGLPVAGALYDVDTGRVEPVDA